MTAPGGKRISADGSDVKRRDIQGLRAVAVVAVVVNHLTGHPVGGFVGVDVFFVISGYLITAILLRDLGARTGALGYLTTFYKRRVRRILPAAIVVIALTLLAAHQVFGASRFASTRTDGWWSLIFWANWHLIDVNTNYFTAGGPVSPLQHYWSLAVEEQFYVVWPILIFFVALVARRRRLSVGLAALAVSGVSLAIAAAQSTSEPTTAYLSSFTRGWELGLGALLACAPALRAPRRVLSLLAWAGTALIAVSLFVTHPGAGFPLPGAMLPCLGAALVIAAVDRDGREPWAPLLSNWVAVRIGDISYSVYLVHFPVIVLLAAGMSNHGAYFYVAAPLLIVGLACALHALVERPILDSAWLRPKRGVREPIATARWMAVALVALVAAQIAIVMQPDAAVALRKQYQAINSAPQQPAPTLPLRLATLQKQIATALRATEYPTLHPSMTDATSGNFAAHSVIACGQSALAPIGSCTIGPADAEHTLYVTGDSTSTVYAEALTPIVEALPHWRLVIRSGFGCPFSSAVFQEVDGAQLGCGNHNETVVQEIERIHPDVLVVTNEYHAQTPVGATSPISATAQIADMHRELSLVRAAVARVVIVAPPPGGADLQDCYRPDRPPVQCVARPSQTWLAMAAADRAAATKAHEAFLDSRGWFCSPAGYCPSFVGDVPTMYDGTHATQAYMRTIAPVLRDALDAADVLPR
jgi:peptidoglycan/LPS O-acetylase OafA/YrhL